MTEYTPYQRKVINRYYDHRDGIMLNKLQEIVTELYLAETEKQKDRLWKRADKAVKALQVPEALREHILVARRVDVLARNVRDWLEQAKTKK